MIMRVGFQMLLFLVLFKPGAILQAADITIWDVAGKAEISLEQAVGKLPSPGIVYVGEFHDNAAHHAAQLAVIQSLNKHKRPLAVGLEMFQHIEQSILDAWVAKEYVRDIYLTDDPAEAEAALDRAIAWCTDPISGRELRTLAKTLARWRTEILAHHTTGASNGRVEAANLTIKQVKRAGRGFRNLNNYRLRILLAGGCPRQTHPVTRHRARPRFIA